RHTRFSRDWSSDVCSSDLSKPTRQHHYHYPNSHEQQRETKDGVYSANKLIDWDNCGNDIVYEDDPNPCSQAGKISGHVVQYPGKIGRASCRERVESSGVSV